MQQWIRHLATVGMFFAATAAAAQPAPRGTSEETTVVTATVVKVDKIARSLTVTDQGLTHTIFCGKELAVFDEIKTGDIVTARFVDSYVAAVKPGAKMQPLTDTTVAAQKNGSASADVMQQLNIVVKVDQVDAARNLIVYRSADNRVVTRLVRDPHLLDGIKRGDVVEVTYTRERALELTKKK